MKLTLKYVIEERQHKYDEDSKCACSEWYKGYMCGWYWAYQDLLDILKQNGFDVKQIVINRP